MDYDGSAWTFETPREEVTADEAVAILTDAFTGHTSQARGVRRRIQGRQFRIRLEQAITREAIRTQELRTAPPEVIHRRVNGETVISRRLR